MSEFLLRIWALTRPYRARLLLGVVVGIIGGLIEPLMLAAIGFVYSVIFPSAGTATSLVQAKLSWAPDFVQEWAASAEQALSSGLQTHSVSVAALVALIPAVIMLRGLFSYLNVYLLQWVSIRTINDLRTGCSNISWAFRRGFSPEQTPAN